MADVTDRDTFWSKITPGALFKGLKEYISYKIDSIDEDLNIHTNLFQHLSGYFASIAFLTTLYGISYIDDPSTYIVIATSLLAFSTFLTLDFFQKYERHQLLHLVNRSGARYPALRAEKVNNRDVPVLFVWEPSISSTVFFTWCNPLAVAIALIANTEGMKSTPRMCLFGVALLLGLQIRALLSKYNKKIDDKKHIFEEGAFINSQFYEKNYILASPETRAANSQSSPDLVNASTSSANSVSTRISNSGISPTKTITGAKENAFTEYGTNYGYMNRKPTVPISYGTSQQTDASPPRRESPVRSAPSSNPSSRHSSMEFPTSSGLFSIMDNNRPSSFYGHGNQNGNANNGLYGLANAPPYTPHIIGMNGSPDMHMMEQDQHNNQQQPQRRTTFGLDQDPPTSSLYDF